MDGSSSAIAIVGLAGRFPGAPDIDAYWRNLSAGIESIRTFSDEELRSAGVSAALLQQPNYVRAKGVLEGADCFDRRLFAFGAREAAWVDPQQRVFLECVWQAFDHAGYDPLRLDAEVGVFAGASMNTYLLHVLQRSPALLDQVSASQLLVASDKDFLPTRVSYKLNLRGPSVNVQTACSTSLVCVHVACQSLLLGECDVAVAGGVSVTAPLASGYLFQENGILSPDGHCRAFDARAAGTVMGNGVGVVILKRLADALADGDEVHAIVRGSAVNNDGNRKVGFTAPSLDGQVAVIREALAVAGVPPAAIDYVEAHGTGTRYGDPIEVAGLARVFAERKGRPPLWIGSVKTNIGHLDAASGIAGLIKAVLALKHQALPASLHFERENPEIEFERTPMRVCSEARAWQATSERFAGVSSFGFGGTNAHVVVEQGRVRTRAAADTRPYLLTLSAQTAQELAAERAAVAQRFAAGDHTVRDAARTLQSGRQPLSQREFWLVGGDDDLTQRLGGQGSAPYASSVRGTRELLFAFPGQGVSLAGLGRELYRELPAFRAHFERLASLAGEVDTELRGWLQGTAVDPTRLHATLFAQPALFAFALSLSELLAEWGLTPAGVVGHSLGEIVAATVAGVFDPAEAMRFVAARGRAMQACPPGSMLSVACAAQDLRELIDGAVHVCAFNGAAQTVVGGEPAALEALAAELRARGVATLPLETNRAFHTPLIAGAKGALERALQDVTLRAPVLPIASTVTGGWLSAELATDRDYWVRQALQPVQFASALDTLTRERSCVLLEVGAGSAITQLTRQQAPRDASLVAHACLPRAPRSELHALLSALGKVWADGVPVDWQRIDSAPFSRVSLPPRPLARERCWIIPEGDAPTPVAATPAQAAAATEALSARGVERPAALDPSARRAAVAAAFAAVLGRAEVAPDDNFFELGGESLLGIDLLARLQRELGVALKLSDLLERPSLRQLGDLVCSAPLELTPEVEAAPLALMADEAGRYDSFPLTPVQLAYWVGRRFVELGGVGSHAYFELDVERLDLERLERALNRLIDRHDMLRAVFSDEGQQRVLAHVPAFHITRDDLASHSAEAREGRLRELREQLSHKVYAGGEWPLFDLRVSQLGLGKARVHFSFDFLIGDAWSLSLILAELAQLYARGECALPAPKLSFRDYAVALERYEQQGANQRSLAFWREQAPNLPGAPELPLAVAPAAIRAPRFVRLASGLDKGQWSMLKRRASELRVTPTALLLAAFGDVLAVWARKAEFTLNLTVFNRPPSHPEINAIVGDFTSLLLVPYRARGERAFAGRAQALQRELWDALQHKDVSAVQVARELGRSMGSNEASMPVVFTSTLGLPSGSGAAELGALGAKLVYGVSQTPQVWLDHQIYEDDGGLVYQWDFLEALFPPGMIGDMFDAYQRLLAQLARPDHDWAHAPQLIPASHVACGEAANATGAPLSEALLDQLFLQQAERDPEARAVITPKRSLSYGQLAALAERVALELRRAGSPERVAVVMPRGYQQVVAVLGTLMSGGAYVPIDAGLPGERVRELLESADVGAVATCGGAFELAATDIPVIDVDVLEASAPSAHALRDAALARAPRRPRACTDLAYVIYTSGSTGKPKGVAIDHRGAVNTILDINRRFQVCARDRVLALSSLSFDLSVYDIFGLLAAGGAIVIPSAASDRSPAHWLELVQSADVTVWNSVPALMELMVEHCELNRSILLNSIKCAMWSGDWIPVSLPARAAKICPQAKLYSLGGATEASIWSNYYPIERVDPDWKSIPYGWPLTNQGIHVLDDALEPRPLWVQGELYLSGTGLAREYFRDSERTNAQFVLHPRTGERLYRTGDWGRRWPDGSIEFLGREDSQVKIRGYRIEISEIEAKLARFPMIDACAVVVAGADHGTRRLVACMVAKGDAPPEPELAEAARAYLAERLPAYMVPSRWVAIEGMPLTRNRKVDRARLTRYAEAVEEPRSRPYVEPSAGVERELAAIWSALLKDAPVGAEDDLFSLGADSLMAIRALGAIQRTSWGGDVLLRDLYAYPTVRGFAERLTAGAPQAAAGAAGS